MVHVGVGQGNPLNRQPVRPCRRQNHAPAAGDGGVNQGEAVIFAHQITVKRPISGQLKKIVSMLSYGHGLLVVSC